MYEASWRELRHVRRLALCVVLAFIVLVYVEHFIDPRWLVTTQLVINFSVWAAFWTYAAIRYQWWRCPRCNCPFQTGFIVGPWSMWPRNKCIHCGLQVGSEE